VNTFTLSPHGEQHRLQHADQNGNGTHIVCTEAELAQLRKLLAPLVWEKEPSGAGKYVRMPFPHLPYIVSFVDVWDYRGGLLANGEGDNARPVKELGGLWLKLPAVPATEGK